MYKVCETSRAKARQEAFQNALLQQLERKEWKDITVVSICEEVATTRKTFYKYFDTIEDVMHSIIDEDVRISEDILKDRENGMRLFFDYWRARKPLMDILERREMSMVLFDRFYVRTFSGGKKAEEFTTGDLKYIGWIYAMTSVLVVWHHSGMKQPSQEMQELVQIMLRIKD